MKRFMIFAALALASRLTSLGALQISTLDKPWDSTTVLSEEWSLGFAFTTDTFEYSLSGISAQLLRWGFDDKKGPLYANLYRLDGNNLDGASLVSFTTEADLGSTTPRVVLFKPDAPFVLAGLTEYVFTLRTATDDTTGWGLGLTSLQNGYDIPSGSGWGMTEGIVGNNKLWPGDLWVPLWEENFRAIASVDATQLSPVPEPSIYGISGSFALIAGILVRVRRMRKPAAQAVTCKMRG